MTDNNYNELNINLLKKYYQNIKQLQKSQKNNCDNESNEPSVNKSDQINKLIEESIQKIEEIKNNQDMDDKNIKKLLGMKTTLLYEQSKLLTTLNRQDEAERLLAKCLDDINEFISSRELIYLALRIINNYGYLLSKREDYEAARKILESGKTVYEAKKDEGFCSSDDLFSPNLSTSFSSKLEHLATNNLQMLAFVYSKLELHDKFAEYHHQVLDRQLEINDDPLGWSIKSTTLAAYLSSNHRFEWVFIFNILLFIRN